MTGHPGVAPQHLLAFGAIVQWFARHEYLMQTAMAGITGTDLSTILVLTAGLSYTAKRDALASLTHTTGLPEPVGEAVRTYLDDLNRHNGLRNAVAHSMWVPGSRPDSIKPMRLIVRGGIGKPVGHIEDERDYLAEELLQVATDVAGIYQRFVEFLLSSGLVREVAAQTLKSDHPHPTA
ncbi:MAG: hypothetical protein F8N37_14370 [Telmatospirillum sp.]|nr:hypothetical protein [Telmatospirillum sp.]